MFLLHGFLFPAIALHRRGPVFFTTARRVWKSGVAVAFISMVAYWLVIWAFSQERIAPVAVLRETSVAFAALISAFLIRERMTLLRTVLILMIVGGIVQLSR